MKHFYRLFLLIPFLSFFISNAMEISSEVPTLKDLCANYVIDNEMKISALSEDLQSSCLENTFVFDNLDYDLPLEALGHAAKISASEKVIKELKQKLLAKLDVDDALHQSVLFRNLKAAEFYIDNGANVNHKDNRGETPLFGAVFLSDQPMLKLLIDSGALVNLRSEYGRTPLIWAVLRDEILIAQILIDSGADINAVDKKDQTALDYAMQFQNQTMIDLLKKNNAVSHKYILWLGKAGIWDVYSKKKVHRLLAGIGIGAAATIIGYCAYKYFKK